MSFSLQEGVSTFNSLSVQILQAEVLLYAVELGLINLNIANGVTAGKRELAVFNRLLAFTLDIIYLQIEVRALYFE